MWILLNAAITAAGRNTASVVLNSIVMGDNTGECLGKMCPAKCTVSECSKCHLQHCFDHRLKVYKELWSSEQKWSVEKYSGCIAILAPKIILTYDMYSLKRKPEDVEEWRDDVEYSDISNEEDWCVTSAATWVILMDGLKFAGK